MANQKRSKQNIRIYYMVRQIRPRIFTILGEDMAQNGHQLREGFNVLQGCYLYYMEEQHVFKWLKHTKHAYWVAEVIPCHDAFTIIINEQNLIDRFFLKPVVTVSAFVNDGRRLAAVKGHGLLLEHIDAQNQTQEICEAAVHETGMALKYVGVQNPYICAIAVRRHGTALQYVKEQTEDICLAAVRQIGWALPHVKEQTPAICQAAVEQTKWARQFVRISVTQENGI